MSTINTTVRDLAASSIDAVRVFEKYSIDYCCGGKRPLDEVCREKGLDTQAVLRELSEARVRPSGEDRARTSLANLIAHIVSSHHEYLKRELPALSLRMAKVSAAHGQDSAILAELAGTFEGLRTELEMHLRKEEMILFPAIERYEACVKAGVSAPPLPFGAMQNPIGMMEHEHDAAGAALAKIRELTNGYAVPAHACITYRALFEGLRELESDLHQHIHLENNILFPRAIEMEREARGK
jgi:regulator of cell morphogenesis and NO signaling